MPPRKLTVVKENEDSEQQQKKTLFGIHLDVNELIKLATLVTVVMMFWFRDSKSVESRITVLEIQMKNITENLTEIKDSVKETHRLILTGAQRR